MTNPLRIANEKPRIGRLPSFVTAAIASAVDFAKKVAGVFKSPSVTSASSVPDSGPNDINQLNPPIPPMRPPTRNKALIVETTFLILVCLLFTGGVWKARSQTRSDVLREENSDKSLQPESSTTQVVSVNSSEGKKVGSDLNEVNEEVNGEGKDWNDETSETDEVTTLRKKATTKQLTYEESPKLKIDDYKKDISDSDGMRNSLNTTEETLENNDKNDNEKDVEKVEVEKKPLSSVEVKGLRQKKAELKIKEAELNQERNEIEEQINQINNKFKVLKDKEYKSLQDGKKEEWKAEEKELQDEMAKSNQRQDDHQWNMLKLRTEMDDVDEELSKYVTEP